KLFRVSTTGGDGPGRDGAAERPEIVAQIGGHPGCFLVVRRRNAMGILGWIVFGLIVGVVAKFLMPGRDPGGFIVTIILGIVGALLGGFIGRAVGWYGPNDPVGFVLAVVGAIVLLIIYRFTLGRAGHA